MATEALDIRPARPTDAQALAALSSQLGYPVAVGSLTDRLDRLLGRADQVVMVACAGSDGVVGWIHGAEQELLEAERRCEILGLVVSHTRRRQRVGQRLVEAVEQWASTRGLVEMSVRSNILRAESHPFYQRVGYERAKTQHVYRKWLAPRGNA